MKKNFLVMAAISVFAIVFSGSCSLFEGSEEKSSVTVNLSGERPAVMGQQNLAQGNSVTEAQAQRNAVTDYEVSLSGNTVPKQHTSGDPVIFSGLDAGIYQVTADAYIGSMKIASGSASVNVVADMTVPVDIKLSRIDLKPYNITATEFTEVYVINEADYVDRYDTGTAQLRINRTSGFPEDLAGYTGYGDKIRLKAASSDSGIKFTFLCNNQETPSAYIKITEAGIWGFHADIHGTGTIFFTEYGKKLYDKGLRTFTNLVYSGNYQTGLDAERIMGAGFAINVE